MMVRETDSLLNNDDNDDNDDEKRDKRVNKRLRVMFAKISQMESAVLETKRNTSRGLFSSCWPPSLSCIQASVTLGCLGLLVFIGIWFWEKLKCLITLCFIEAIIDEIVPW